MFYPMMRRHWDGERILYVPIRSGAGPGGPIGNAPLVVDDEAEEAACPCLLQGRRCSDDTLVDLWLRADPLPAGIVYYAYGLLPVPGVNDALCVYFDPSEELVVGCPDRYLALSEEENCEDCLAVYPPETEPPPGPIGGIIQHYQAYDCYTNAPTGFSHPASEVNLSKRYGIDDGFGARLCVYFTAPGLAALAPCEGLTEYDDCDTCDEEEPLYERETCNGGIMDPLDPDYIDPDDATWPATIRVEAARIQGRSAFACVQDCFNYDEILTKVPGQYRWEIAAIDATSCAGIGCGVELVDIGGGDCGWDVGFGPLSGSGATGSRKLDGNDPYGTYPNFGAILTCPVASNGNGGTGIVVS